MLRTLFAIGYDADDGITSSTPSLEPNRKSKRIQRKHRYVPMHRRGFKSSPYFARFPRILAALLFLSSCSMVCSFATNNNKSALNKRRHEWIGKSVQYYSTVMRKQAASAVPTLSLECDNDIMLDENFIELATKHYYARFLIKQGKWSSAEKIYRRIIDELASEKECDNTKLAVSTLLLALHMQRTGDTKATRTVFLNFFRRVALAEDEEEVHTCSCSAKVLQAFALFEMKNGFSGKSLMLVQRAVQMDESLSPVLGWKQFRDAAAGRPYRPTFSFKSRKSGDE